MSNVSCARRPGSYGIFYSYKAFFELLGQQESSNRYNIKNYAGYLGRYQMGELALIDAGYYNRDYSGGNNWVGNWTDKADKDGVDSKNDFLNSCGKVQVLFIVMLNLFQHLGNSRRGRS